MLDARNAGSPRAGEGDDPWRDDPELARRIVREGLGALAGSRAVVDQIRGLTLLSNEEKRDIGALRARIAAYLKLPAPTYPFCVGIFGPPGSGKSFTVKEMAAVDGYKLQTLNLSQFESPGELMASLAQVAGQPEAQRPVIFLDEFDSRLGGAPLGWLQWLLAPMQDGKVFHRGVPVELRRAVFVFAGGTADSFEQFPDAHSGYFRGAKGPDFISRLRGHLNVRGANDWPYRRVRRAVSLRLALQRVGSSLIGAGKKISTAGVTDAFVDQLLAVGRYRHGGRSVDAIVDMSTSPGQTHFSQADLPAPRVLANHVDDGPLGSCVIALSAGGVGREGEGGDYDRALDEAWPRVGTRLLELGAALVYGGDLRRDGFTRSLADASSRLPNPLVSEDRGERPGDFSPRPGRVVWVRRRKGAAREEVPSWPRVDVLPVPDLSADEFAELGLDPDTVLSDVDRSAVPQENWRASPAWRKHLGNALAMFRMRVRVTQLADAHLVFGGREKGFTGRFPGIAEEVMLSLAAGNAIYVCGGFGGAAHAVGQVLGLGEPWAVVPACLQREHHGRGAAVLEIAVREWGGRFQLPHRSDLPVHYPSLVEFLRAHAIRGPRWPDNGLTLDENRRLFRAVRTDEIMELVETGLRRRADG